MRSHHAPLLYQRSKFVTLQSITAMAATPFKRMTQGLPSKRRKGRGGGLDKIDRNETETEDLRLLSAAKALFTILLKR